MREFGKVFYPYTIYTPMTNRQGAPPPTRPRIGFNIPRLNYDTIAVKHVKKLKFSSYRINAWKRKILKNVLCDRKQKIWSYNEKKTALKKITAFNYTKNVENTYTHFIMIKGYPHARAKKMTFTKKVTPKKNLIKYKNHFLYFKI